ncbi:MAG: NAD(P)/FAD-dependent oxidoreductase [Nanoarchaeota archaeon]
MIHIIGAGPAGLFCGKTIREKDPTTSVVIYEEHDTIGVPIQCTGIVTSEIATLVNIPKGCIATKIHAARIHAPNKKYVEIRFAKPDIILYRDKFDQHLEQTAKKEGATIKKGWKLTSIKNKTLTFLIKGKKKTIKLQQGDIVIGADGPNSTVAKDVGLNTHRQAGFGIQVVMRTKHDEKIHFYPYIGSYAWLCPEGVHTARIGIDAKTDPKAVFDSFIKNFKGEIIASHSGRIPLFKKGLSKQVRKAGIPYFLIGDAASQTKNTTGGGIIAGMKAGQLLGELIAKGKEKEYAKAVWKVEKHLYLHYLIAKAFQKFTDDDWNELITKFNKKELKKILAQTNRDNLTRILLRVILKEPNVLKYIKHLF